jgi:pullulanase/glycogen debranching enzyme
MEPRRWSRYSGYFFEDGAPVFVLWPEIFPHVDCRAEDIRVAGPFNNWQPGGEWRLLPEIWDGDTVLTLRTIAKNDVAAEILRYDTDAGVPFKFTTQSGVWLEVPTQTVNRKCDAHGNFNYILSPSRTGHHVFAFVSETPASLAGHEAMVWDSRDGNRHAVNISRGDFLLQQDSSLEMGAHVHGGCTHFRLFAPRATAVTLELWPPDATATARHKRLPLAAHADGVWELEHQGALHGWRYQYTVSGENTDASTDFDTTVSVLDPYALATLSPAGPGLVVDTARIAFPQTRYQPPAPTDLVIIEAHVRDLVARLPGSGPRPGFRELAAWVRSPDCYLRQLGVNAIELQPVQEFDGTDPAAYHWGYMPVNWFAPASAYARDPAAGTQIEDLQDLVAACHEAGLAVIFDVVYNHVGEPNHLRHIDKSYYLETTRSHELSNWSGCGNDVRPSVPMVRRLIFESLRHLIECFDVDGFRFDLAELLGVPLLHKLERELRPLKPGLILIAEPWSFRGHIGRALLHTGYTSWNDNFREYLPAWVHAAADATGLRHFLSGSPITPEATPAHTLNYTESHDDFCWLDRITENPGNNGTKPTANDACRTRLMGAVLLAAQGVPMLAQGQDFLRTKNGRNNTYLRGDVNALDYARLQKFHTTHVYFRDWIAFRLSDRGAALRLHEQAQEGFFKFFHAEHTCALAAWYNADGHLPVPPLFFAANPHPHPVAIWIPGVDSAGFRQLADMDRFCSNGLPPEAVFDWQAGVLTLPPMSVGLWETVR